MNILILDIESTGLDPAKDRAIEVGCVLYSLQHSTMLRSFSTLIAGDGNAAEAINRIPPAAVIESTGTWAGVAKMAANATAIVAHNADFDRSFSPPAIQAALPWVCSMSDLAWPRPSESRSLVSIALAHGLGVATAHRAIEDCLLIARLFTRARELGADLEAMLERGLRPKALFVGLAPFERNDEMKAAGFAWDRIVKRAWARKMAIEDAAALPFATRQVAP